MKKEYKTPTMKVRTFHCSHMLCGSNSVRFYSESVSDESEDNEYFGEDGYGDAW